MKHKRALTPQSRRIDSQHQQNRAMRSANDGKNRKIDKAAAHIRMEFVTRKVTLCMNYVFTP
jgi:hypothetical protein